MTRQRRHSEQTLTVLRSMAVEPSRWRHGYELGSELGMKSGSLYPILIRLADRGLLEASWEQAGPGKLPRHMYRLTGLGLAEALATHRPSPVTTRRRELGTA